MKKILIGLLLTAAMAPTFAQHVHPGHGYRPAPHHHRGYWHGGRWVAPLVIGAGVTYLATRPAPVVIQEPVVIEQPVDNCTPWREIQQPDGTIVRERTCQR